MVSSLAGKVLELGDRDVGGSWGSPQSTAPALGMSGMTASGFQTSIQNNASPRAPHCETQHKQYVPSLLLKEKTIFWVMPPSPSLKPGKDGEGAALSPGLSTHLCSLLCIITCNLYATLLEKH